MGCVRARGSIFEPGKVLRKGKKRGNESEKECKKPQFLYPTTHVFTLPLTLCINPPFHCTLCRRTRTSDLKLPEYTNEEKFRFGKDSGSSEDAGTVIHPKDEYENTKEYRQRTFDESKVTKPTNRGYDWDKMNINPRTHTFGKVHHDNITGGIIADTSLQGTKIVKKSVVDKKCNTSAPLGRTKNLSSTVQNLPSDYVFGSRPKETDDWGARKCIHGTYSEDDLLPDKDLGVSKHKINSGMHIPQDRTNDVFGAPSIRNNRPTPKVRSIADNTVCICVFSTL